MSAGTARKRKRPIALAAAIFLVEGHSLHAASPRRALFELTWSAPPGCPDELHLRDTIEHLAGPGDPATETPLAARAVATRGTDGLWRLHLETERSGNHGERDITGESCEALAGSAAVILALVLNPSADLAAFNPSELEGSATGSKPAPPGDTRLVPSPTPAPTVDGLGRAASGASADGLGFGGRDELATRRRTRWLVGASGAVDGGTFPEPAWGLSAFVGGRFGHARIEVPFTWWVPQRRVISADREAGGDFSLVMGGLFGCYDFAVSPSVLIGPCAGLELGAMHAKAFGVRAPGEAVEPWVAAFSGASAVVELTPSLGLELDLLGGVPLRRPDFVLEGVGSVHQPSRILGRTSLGARMQF